MSFRVAIIGRPNVGKSSLFNMLARRMLSIVDPTAGVTRDRLSTMIELPAPLTSAKGKLKGADDVGADPLRVELTDTGGYGIHDLQAEELSREVERQITHALAVANLVIFLIDAQIGVTPLDEEVVRVLRNTQATVTGHSLEPERVLLVANKVDAERYAAAAYEAAAFGFGEPVMLSTTSGYGKTEFVDALRDRCVLLAERDGIDLQADDTPEWGDDIQDVDGDGDGDDREDGDEAAGDRGVRVGRKREPSIAIVGKRNAGKSTLVNALAGADRVITSEIEGTTRDAVDVRFELDGRSFVAIDTAGVRRRKSMKQDLEFYSYHRALRSIRRADVVVLLIDATLPVSHVDVSLSREVMKHYKPTIIAVNKWDLVEEQVQDEFVKYLDKPFGALAFCPIVFLSAKEADGIRELMAMALNLHEQAGHRVGTGELNRVVERIIAEKTPSSKHGKRPKLFYATQLEVDPPTIALFVNDPDLFTPEYQRFLLNRFRDALPFSEVPIKLLIRQRSRMPRG